MILFDTQLSYLLHIIIIINISNINVEDSYITKVTVLVVFLIVN